MARVFEGFVATAVAAVAAVVQGAVGSVQVAAAGVAAGLAKAARSVPGAFPVAETYPSSRLWPESRVRGRVIVNWYIASAKSDRPDPLLRVGQS